MKKIILYIFILFFSLSSCKKFLVEAPRTAQNSVDFFKTENDFNLAVNGAYAALRDIYGSKSSWLMGEMRSDNTHYDYKPSDGSLAVVQRSDAANFLNDKFSGQTSDKWVRAYVAISRANAILDQVDAASFSADSKRKIAGQAKFIRALSYFELVRYYGQVPIYVHLINNPDEIYVPKSSVAQVYDLIISDAKDAIEKLDAATFPQTGAATKGAALTLLADAYINLKRFPEAEPLLKEVTQQGYSLMANYADVFTPANKNNKESIFEIQYNSTLATPQSSNFIYNFIPRMSNSTAITGLNQNTITDLGGFNTPTQDLISSFETDDNRLPASIAIAEGTWNSSNDFVPASNTAGSAVKNIVGYTPPPGMTGRPFPKKFLHPHTLPNQTNNNWPVYRYAEVLLLLAETLNEQNKPVEALPYLNLVRDRAFGAGVSPVTTVDQTELRAIILHERRVELAFENKRWIDLVRTGNAISVMTAYGIAMKAANNYLPSNSFNITESSLLFPIPYTEIELNPLLE
ncbi:RagB/SusD family nutrient uptake outer membrane protein [Pseudoflavitalea rhizosphaerae]|uniref:RagB/SusD family nutrient uptake outer membrane protein n=1 Tax=Pseudoflavitalea rhizosphaerae TaxID=1884793 RepID=UPI000F8EC890|nr:RagB/SusD family nutrient uptake outer membrane protein [Pseudoflavitalea rhizosphaerae]